MKWSRVQAGQAKEAPRFESGLLLEMRLNIHARLGAPENDQFGHRRSITA